MTWAAERIICGAATKSAHRLRALFGDTLLKLNQFLMKHYGAKDRQYRASTIHITHISCPT